MGKTAEVAVRIHPIVLLAAWLSVSSCGDPDGPSGDGTLVVLTATSGDAPDPDGYRLAVDDRDTLALGPSGSAELEVRAGAHALRLLGVAEHCSVEPGVSLELEVAPASRTPVAFAIDCPATGVRVTTVTTGLDVDANGYRVTVNTVDRLSVPANGAVLVQLSPGEHVIGVTGLAPNCTLGGAASRTVTIVEGEVVPIELTTVCTATSGVVGVLVRASGTDMDGDYTAVVDGRSLFMRFDEPAYQINVAPGDHVVSLIAPDNCVVETGPQTITLTAGTLVRDTAEVSFSVSCRSRVATLRVTATTSGTPPAHGYAVYSCDAGFYCYWYPYRLGTVAPHGTLVSEVVPGSYDIWLEDVPEACAVSGPSSFTIEPGEILDLEFSVSCP